MPRHVFLRLVCCFSVVLLAGLHVPRVQAQFGEEETVTAGGQVGPERVQKYQVGLTINTPDGPAGGILATVPVPGDWPEQSVRIVEEDLSPAVKIQYREVGGGVKQMVVKLDHLAPGEEAHALVTFEVTRHAWLAPEETSIFKLPVKKKLPRELLQYLGSSPKIESTNRKIKALAKEVAEKEHATAWEHVEALYDLTREKVVYKNGPNKGALAALNDGSGDCEELTSLFIALCRASEIPARTVWVPEHCYPEFYLLDEEGEGHWLVCEMTGSRMFGANPNQLPILQKGDNFRVPERPKENQRYVAEYLTAKQIGPKPKVKFVRKAIN